MRPWRYFFGASTVSVFVTMRQCRFPVSFPSNWSQREQSGGSVCCPFSICEKEKTGVLHARVRLSFSAISSMRGIGLLPVFFPVFSPISLTRGDRTQ